MKNGIVRDVQRYLCRSCGCNFTMTPPRGKPPAMKALAMLLYAMGNVSFCSIARILGVSDVAVLNWVRDEARKLPEPSTQVAFPAGLLPASEPDRATMGGDAQEHHAQQMLPDPRRIRRSNPGFPARRGPQEAGRTLRLDHRQFSYNFTQGFYWLF